MFVLFLNEPIKEEKLFFFFGKLRGEFIFLNLLPEFSHKSFIAGDKRSAQTILGQQYFINCIARFFQNLST